MSAENSPADVDALPLRIGCHGCHATRLNDLKRPLWRLANRLRREAVRVGRIGGLVKLVQGPPDVRCGPHDLVVLCLVRNGAMWLRSYVEHHLALGVKHIFFLDNASTDDTVERASRYRQVSVYSTPLSFRHFQLGLRQWLVHTLGWNRWSLCPDADELWDYPCSDRLSLPDFLRYLEAGRYKAVASHMLDMFSNVPFSRLTSSPEDDIRSKYPFYDVSDVIKTREMYWFRKGQVSSEELFCTFGGVRQRYFGTQCLCQTRHALHFTDARSQPYRYDGHFTAGGRVADVSAVLLHYKYIGSLYSQARSNLERRSHYDASRNYQGFIDVLAEDREFSLYGPHARRLCSTDQLVREGFLTVSDRYRDWVEARSHKRSAGAADPALCIAPLVSRAGADDAAGHAGQ